MEWKPATNRDSGTTRNTTAFSEPSNCDGVIHSTCRPCALLSFPVFSALPMDRAYICFFDNKDKPSFHASSGFTRNFQPKPSFHALAHLQRTLCEYRFDHIVTNE